MSYQTNNPNWKGGYNGNQCPSNATPQQVHDWNQGRLQKEAELRKQQEQAWGKK